MRTKTSTAKGLRVAVPSLSSARLRVGASVGALAVAGSLLGTAVVLAPAESAEAATIPTVSCTTDPAIFNTGFNSASGGQTPNGAEDERWTVAGGISGLNYSATPYSGPSPAALPPAGTAYAPAYAGKINTAWTDSQSGRSQWISANYVPPSNGQNQLDGGGDWYYRYQFTLDPQVDPGSFQLDMSWLADNAVAGVWVNNVAQSGTNLPQSPGNPHNGPGFLPGQEAVTSLNNSWTTGLNTILVQVKSNHPAQGFNAEVRSRALCPTLQVQKTVDGRVAASDQFTVTAADGAGTAVTTTTTTGTATTATSARVPVTFGATYTITDAMAAGSTSGLSRYEGLLACTDTTTGQPVPVSGTGPSWTVTISTHDAYLCNVTNAAKAYTVAKSSSPASVFPGETVEYTVTVVNTGQGAYTEAAPATFTDDLTEVLDDATYVPDSATDGATVDGDTLSWSGPLAVGETKTITYSVTVNDPATGDRRLENVVAPPVDNGGTCATEGGCKTLTPVKTFTVDKSAEPVGPTFAGDTVTYTVTVVNTGQADYTEESPASFTDDLSAVLDDGTYNDDASNGATVDGSTLSWSGPLAVGETMTITYSVTVNDPATGDGNLENVVTMPPNTGGTCAKPEGCKTNTLVGAFTVDKTVDKTTTLPGEVVRYTVTVTNTGHADYTDEFPATFDDDLSKVADDATYNGDASKGATVEGNKLSWAGALGIGQSVTVTYSFTVNDPISGDQKLTNAVIPGDGGTCAAPGSCSTATSVETPIGPLVATGGSTLSSAGAWPWIGSSAAALAGMIALALMALRRRSTLSGD